MSRTEVHKFGGTSVGGADRLRAVAHLVADAGRHTRLVVVTSALGGVTDDLERVVRLIHDHERDAALGLVDEIMDRHRDTLRDLGGDAADMSGVAAALDTAGAELHDLAGGAAVLGEVTARTRDRVIATGERMAAELLALAVRDTGPPARALRADAFLETDGRFGQASPIPYLSARSIRSALKPVLAMGETAVVTGFTGRAPDGSTTTLGRGGSDLSATIIAAAIEADEVTIWTDVEGVFSADPRVVPNALAIPQLHYREAGELSFYGAKVLHQRTMIPVVQNGIPVRVRNSFDVGRRGTVVDRRCSRGSHPVKAITAIRDQCLIAIEGQGMSGVPGVAARAFESLARRDISVVMISQSSSESSICLVAPADDGETATAALKREFRPDLGRGDVEQITLKTDVGLVAAVGLGMAHVPGIAGRLFSALGRRGVNVLAIAQGSSELNVTLAVEGTQVDDAVRAIHDEFRLHLLDTGEDAPDSIDVMLIGSGLVGRALVGVIRQRGAAHDADVPIRIVAMADRSGYRFDPRGLGDDEVDEILSAKAAGTAIAEMATGVAAASVSDMIREATTYRLGSPVVVDVSDADDNAPVYIEALQRGCDVVTANKKPLAGDPSGFRSIMDAARSRGRVVRAEATVGAGLPVIDTLEMLVRTSDRIRRIEGCLSGTLAFVTDALDQGTSFAEAVRTAVDRGFTEPDPAADLAGTDVARKAIILGRLSGLQARDEDAAVRLEGLIDPSWAGLDRRELFVRLASLDAEMTARVEAARSEGNVLRFVATVERGLLAAGPQAVPRASALGRLSGTDNMIVFRTDRYHETPLVVSGPGAGPDVTAMGILADVLRIAGERRSPR